MAVDIDIRTYGFDECAEMFKQLTEKEIKPLLRSALRDGAKVIQADAIANVPVKTGDLKKGIKVRSKRKKRRGDVAISVASSSDDLNVVHQEYGTKHHAAQQYMRPAFWKNVDRILKSIAQSLKSRLERKLTNA